MNNLNLQIGLTVFFLFMLSVLASPAHARFAQTLPQGTFLLDVSYNYSLVDSRWDNEGKNAPIIEEIERYEPGGGLQGVLKVDAEAQFQVLIPMLQYGILDDLSVGFGIPIVLKSSVQPNFSWEVGQYQPTLGRAYSEDDFWEFAESMGQPKPGNWSGNKGVLSDIALGMRYQWTRRIGFFQDIGLHSALSIMGMIPTGKSKDPEEVVSAGTSMWDLHAQGELNFHLGIDKTFEEELDGYLTLGLDFFYEIFFEHTYTSARGEINPLLLNYALYIGDTYTIDPGDFTGFSFEADVVAYKGPAWGTWLVKGDTEKAKSLPPLISLSLRYTFIHLQQTDYTSESDLWDWEQEDDWRPGYKNMLGAKITFSFLRLGAPFQLYAGYRTLSLIPGKNTRAADVIQGGIQIPMKFW